jgi:hypothetical protein
LILKRRLILKLSGAWRVGHQFSKQLNLKPTRTKLRTLGNAIPPRLILNGGNPWTFSCLSSFSCCCSAAGATGRAAAIGKIAKQLLIKATG